MNAPTDLKWAAKFPDLGTGPIPVEPCISPEFYEEERKKVFLKSWLKVGRVEEIAKPGDYKVKKLAFAKTSVILMRGKDGQIRGFHNTCSHRGNKVIVETGEETFGRNKAAVVTCRFHGWVYNANGKIVQVPEENKFHADFDNEIVCVFFARARSDGITRAAIVKFDTSVRVESRNITIDCVSDCISRTRRYLIHKFWVLLRFIKIVNLHVPILRLVD